MSGTCQNGGDITQARTGITSHCPTGRACGWCTKMACSDFVHLDKITGKSKLESSLEYLPTHTIFGLSGLAVTNHPVFLQLLPLAVAEMFGFIERCSQREPRLRFSSCFRISNCRTHILFLHCLPSVLSFTASCIFL